MPREEVSTQGVDLEGTVLDMGEPPADGDVVDSGRVALVVANDSGSAVDVTVRATASVHGLDVEDAEISVAAGDTVMIGPFPRTTFGRDAESDHEDQVHVDYSAQTDVTRTVVAL